MTPANGQQGNRGLSPTATRKRILSTTGVKLQADPSPDSPAKSPVWMISQKAKATDAVEPAQTSDQWSCKLINRCCL